jgi:hypothetical protein
VAQPAQEELEVQRGLAGGIARDEARYELVDRHGTPAYHTPVL